MVMLGSRIKVAVTLTLALLLVPGVADAASLSLSIAAGQASGSSTGRARLGDGSYGSVASGRERKYTAGGDSVYVRLTNVISARSTVTRDSAGIRSNDDAWVSFYVTSWHADATSRVEARLCQDRRWRPDPCSGPKVIYRK